MKKYSLFYFSLIIMLAGLSAGCDDSGVNGGQVCTLIGCDDGVTVQLSEERPDSLTLTVYLNDETDAFESIFCTNEDNSCFIRVGGTTPETVTTEIEWDNGELKETFTPEYESFQPNGPNCPPTCKTALIEIDLSGR